MNSNNRMIGGISRKTLSRLPVYYQYIKELDIEKQQYISAPAVAEALGLNEVQVRKELALVSSKAGRPKAGFKIKELIKDFENYLGYENTNQAILVGVGYLGKSLLAYKSGFEQYGIEIVAVFDNDPFIIDTEIFGKKIITSEKITDLCSRLNIHIGIITTPETSAQEVCDEMVKGGIKAIWNFTTTRLNVPDHVFVHNENIAASLATLSKYLLENR